MTNDERIIEAAAILRCGGLVAMPTETVYGLGADAENELAVRRIFAAKGRPVDHPLIVHLADAAQIVDWVETVPSDARLLADAFWPGPLTLILRRNAKAAEAVTGGLETIGLRIPSHPIAQALLREFGGGVAAPSANRFGRVSPTRAEHVREELGDQVEMILDGGPCEVGVESTIVDLSNDHPCLLRPGAITPDQIAAVLDRELVDPALNATRCSGRLESHYAPRAAVEIVSVDAIRDRAAAWLAQGRRTAVLSASSLGLPREVIHLELPRDPVECARHLYERLRQVDALSAEIVLIVPPVAEGLGLAVADRLSKAAAKRD